MNFGMIRLKGGPLDGTTYQTQRLDLPVNAIINGRAYGRYAPSGEFDLTDLPVFVHQSVAIEENSGLPVTICSAFGRSKSREVLIEEGKRYIIEPLNKQSKKNRGRICIALRIVYKDIHDFCGGLSVKYEDSGRIGIVHPGDLVPARKSGRRMKLSTVS